MTEATVTEASAPAAEATPTTETTTTPSQQPSEPAKDTGDLLFGEKPPEDGQEKPDGEKPDGEDGEKGDDAEVVEAKVDFEKITLPEGIAISEESKEALQSFITKHKLSPEAAQDAAQELADIGASIQQKQVEQWQNMKQEWRQAVENDPKLGGHNLRQTIDSCDAVVRKFVGGEAELQEFQADLTLLGLGNKLSFIRFLSNVHAATAEDKLGGKSATAQPAPKSMAQRMYPNMRSEAE